MTIENAPTAAELGDLALIASELDQISERLNTRKSQVSIGRIELFDSNGEELGWLDNPEGLYIYRGPNFYTRMEKK